jgi:ABC-type sugar transport system ATPase subunit
MSSSSNTPVLRTIGLSKSYGPIDALSDVTLDIAPGSVLALLGENGAGKSTFISLVSGATIPTAGQIEIDGERVGIHSPLEATRLGIQVVHQEPKLANEASIAENIYLSRYAGRSGFALVNRRAMITDATAHLARLGLASELPSVVTPAFQLTAAQRQLVAIAKAMATEARVLFLDEPNSSLTPRETRKLWDLVRTLCASGVAVVVVSHRLSELYEVVDRVAVLRDGVLVATGRVDEMPIDRAVSLMAGRARMEAVPRLSGESAAIGDEILRAEDIWTEKVHGVNLTVRAGEIVGLVGLVGSGRTEIGRAICGADPLLAGQIYLHGHPVRFGSPKQALAHGVVMTSEERRRSVFESHDVTFNMVASSLSRLASKGFLSGRRERSLAATWVDRLALRGTTATPIVALSGGNQQKALIARSLATNPSVIILDEPTHGIDVRTKGEIAALVKQLAAEGLGVIFISSEVEELVGIASRVVVIRNGRVAQVASGADGVGLIAAALGEIIPATDIRHEGMVR